MEAKPEQSKPPAVPQERRMNSFWKSVLATAVPLAAAVAVSMAWSQSIVGRITAGVAGFGSLAAFVAAIVLAIVGRRQIAAGLLAGLGFGALSAVISCFAFAATGRIRIF